LKERGDAVLAGKEYEGLLDSGQLTDTDREIAQRGLAGSLALQSKCGEAIPIWKEILAKGSLIIPEDIYLSLGDCYESSGQPAEALKTFEELIQKHPGSPFITPRLRERMRGLK
jgi:tetratricopeptide (TPR) repeat protein